MRSAKSKILISAAVLVLLCAAGIFVYTLTRGCGAKPEEAVNAAISSNKASVSSAIDNASAEIPSVTDDLSEETSSQQLTHYIEKMNSPLSIKSSLTQKQEGDAPDLNWVSLGWDGELRFTVTRARLYKDYQAAGISSDDISLDTLEEVAEKYLEVELLIENISAKDYGAGYEFYIGTANLTTRVCFDKDYVDDYPDADILRDVAYFADPGEDKRYYFFDLPEGKSLKTTVGYFVSEAMLEEDLVIRISDSEENRFAFSLDDLEVMS